MCISNNNLHLHKLKLLCIISTPIQLIVFLDKGEPVFSNLLKNVKKYNSRETKKLTFLRRLSSSVESSLQCVLLEFLHQFVVLDFLASSSGGRGEIIQIKINNSTTSEKRSHQKFIAQLLERNIFTNRGKNREIVTTTFLFTVRN